MRNNTAIMRRFVQIHVPPQKRTPAAVNRHPDHYIVMNALNERGHKYSVLLDVFDYEPLTGPGEASYILDLGYGAHERRTVFALVKE